MQAGKAQYWLYTSTHDADMDSIRYNRIYCLVLR